MPKNEMFSAISHLMGFVFSVAGLALLVILASIKGTVWQIVGSAIFGASLILLYLASTVYHFIPVTHKAKSVFQKIDHSMIYVLILGSYVPVCITILRGFLGWSILGMVLSFAVTGIVLKVAGVNLKDWISALAYVIMGWIMVIAIPQLLQHVSYKALLWMVIGGIFYTVGAVFFVLEDLLPKKSLFGMHDVFHLFVMAGSFSHFWFMLNYVI